MDKICRCRRETLALYRRCLRGAKAIDAKLPGGGSYYARYALENIRAYTLERDEYTIRTLLEKGENDRRWVLRKYGIHDPTMDTEVDFVQGMEPSKDSLFGEPGEESQAIKDARHMYDDVDLFWDPTKRRW